MGQNQNMRTVPMNVVIRTHISQHCHKLHQMNFGNGEKLLLNFVFLNISDYALLVCMTEDDFGVESSRRAQIDYNPVLPSKVLIISTPLY